MKSLSLPLSLLLLSLFAGTAFAQKPPKPAPQIGFEAAAVVAMAEAPVLILAFVRGERSRGILEKAGVFVELRDNWLGHE
jgi:hypothetical protein